ncbi:unnamed protein product [Closterium sp. NIES-65]|nr:unnamed protein product [Closterium sp. NIES-65]
MAPCRMNTVVPFLVPSYLFHSSLISRAPIFLCTYCLVSPPFLPPTQAHKKALQVPGRALSAIITHLKSSLSPADFFSLSTLHFAVVAPIGKSTAGERGQAGEGEGGEGVEERVHMEALLKGPNEVALGKANLDQTTGAPSAGFKEEEKYPEHLPPPRPVTCPYPCTQFTGGPSAGFKEEEWQQQLALFAGDSGRREMVLTGKESRRYEQDIKRIAAQFRLHSHMYNKSFVLLSKGPLLSQNSHFPLTHLPPRPFPPPPIQSHAFRMHNSSVVLSKDFLPLTSRMYNKSLVLSKDPLPHYRPELDSRRPQRQLSFPPEILEAIDRVVADVKAKREREESEREEREREESKAALAAAGGVGGEKQGVAGRGLTGLQGAKGEEEEGGDEEDGGEEEEGGAVRGGAREEAEEVEERRRWQLWRINESLKRRQQQWQVNGRGKQGEEGGELGGLGRRWRRGGDGKCGGLMRA